MANTRSAKKSVRVIARRTAVNKNRRSRVRTFIRKVEETITAGSHDEARSALQVAESEIMRATKNGIMHKNTASRKISRLSKRIKQLAQ